MTEQMLAAASLIEQQNAWTPDQGIEIENALNAALTIIHGTMIEPVSLMALADIDIGTLFDENWPVGFLRQYDRDDVMRWTVNVNVVPGPDVLPTVDKSVSAKAPSMRGAGYAALIRAAVLFESLTLPPEKIAA